MVRSKVCSIVEGREKLLVPKLDYLVKHSRMKKCIVVKLGVAIRQWYVCKISTHVKNEHMFSSTGGVTRCLLNSKLGAKRRRNRITYSSLQSSNCCNRADPWQISKVWNHFLSSSKSKTTPPNIVLIWPTRAWRRLCIMLFWVLSKLPCKSQISFLWVVTRLQLLTTKVGHLCTFM
jgi:hypothetical protein